MKSKSKSKSLTWNVALAYPTPTSLIPLDWHSTIQVSKHKVAHQLHPHVADGDAYDKACNREAQFDPPEPEGLPMESPVQMYAALDLTTLVAGFTAKLHNFRACTSILSIRDFNGDTEVYQKV
ncbi:hypothetical protein ACH5RR_008938 [Cinchona calisaya]|uniref:Uncharacterized protein n=1 Tax=Cinchona calisaya TaxID=153742 RepID=A0ABD3AF89_9GENT